MAVETISKKTDGEGDVQSSWLYMIVYNNLVIH